MDAYSPWDSYPAAAHIDLKALAANAARLRAYAPNARHMGIVKADAYGHGRAQVATVLAENGYDILGAAQLSEALALRHELDAAGFNHVDIFSWMLPPRAPETIKRALAAGIEVSVSSVEQLRLLQQTQMPARVHLKVDTGMGRAGVEADQLPELVTELLRARGSGIETVAVWSHLARADETGPDAAAATAAQQQRFDAACEQVETMGLTGLTRHLAATSGIIWHPQLHYDMVRDGIGLYGLSPDPTHASSEQLGLQPVMTLTAQLSLVKPVRAGQTVSYGGTWVAPRDTWLAVVPLGYGDGIPRHASNAATVLVRGTNPIRARIVGRVCMDQFVVDLGPTPHAPAAMGDEVVLFSAGRQAAGAVDNCLSTGQVPSADDWARCSGTINYEIVTRVGARVPRHYSN
ncbi:MAG: alanine racemase [Actinomycetaceae bacterium]|nr:alanine racemase [Actinomycetaceae bacterium]